MKATEIKIGITYHDGKVGVRKVVAINDQVVRYQLLAAKVENGWDVRSGKIEHHIGAEFGMTLAGFATWAKSAHDEASAEMLLTRLAARKVKLSPGELAFMTSVKAEGGALPSGSSVSFDHTEGRAVTGLAKKGLLVKEDGEVTISVLGAAWLSLDTV